MMSPNVSSDEPDVEHYKMMMRASMSQQDDPLNRSQEFLGKSDTFSPRTSIKKSPRPGGNNSGDRPDDWLGSPASKRKSYTIKGSTTGKSPGTTGRHSIAASSLRESSIPAVELSPSKSPTGRPPIGISRHTIKGQTASLKADGVLEESQSPKSTMPSGITRHSLGGSSSHHKSTSMPGEPSPDPEYYKTIMRASMQDGPNRSKDFLGGSDHGLSPNSSHGTFKKPSPKPSIPISPDRPTEWLGSPASSSRKSYTIKAPAVASIPNLDDDEDDFDDVGDVKLPPEIIAVATGRQARPIKAQSIAIGASAPLRASPTKKSAPRVKSQSLSLDQRAPWEASPVGKHERVDRGKFVAAFSIFENSKTDLNEVSSHSDHSPKLSPCLGVKRNFTISDEAKRRSLALSLDTTSPTEKSTPNDELQSVVARLRKVTLTPGGSTGGPKEATWLQRIQQLRMTGAKEYSDMLQNLQDRGLVSCNLGPKRMDQVRQAIVRLDQVRKQNPKAQRELSTVLDSHLRKLTPTSSGSFDSIQQAIGRLRKVVVDDRTGVEEVISTLDSVLESMQEGQEAELAQALSSMNNKEEAIHESEEQPQEEPVQAFSIFENSKTDLNAAAGQHSGHHSPKLGAKRNFTISDDAKRRSLALSLDNSTPTEKSTPNDELQSVVARLRKVTLTPGGSTGGPKDATWLQRIQQLRMTGAKEYSDILQNLQDRGLVSCNLGPKRMDQVRQAIVRLDQVRKQNPKAQGELSTVLDSHLRKLTPTSSGSFDSIQQAIARLRKVVIDDRTGVEEVISTLDSVLESMQEGQEAELAQALSSMNNKEEAIHLSEEQPQEEPVQEPEELTLQKEKEPATPSPVKKDPATRSPIKKDNKQDRIRFAKSRVSPQDADFLVQALLKLKKAQLSKHEAGKIAGFVRHLRPVERSDRGTSSDEAFTNLSKELENNEHSDEILDVLNGLRKIRLNDPERAELAEVVRGLGKGYQCRNEIADAISNLRKVQFTPSEAKEAAGIMFNLRKVKKRVTFNLDQSREMVNLRKVMAPEKANAVADAFMELSKADLSEKEMDELAGAVVDLGVVPLDQDDYQLISVEYHDGRPAMVLNIPAGEEYLEHMKESDAADCINAETTGTTGDVRFSVNVDREDSDDKSLGEDRSSEHPGVSEMESPRKPRMTVKIRKSMPSPRPSPIVSPKRASAKKLHHYGDGQNDEASPLDEADERKIRFSHKPHWRHKKHNCTVVNEKRWRFEEDFNADEVIWSPLSREQYDRRKTVGASILKSMMEFAPLDDMVLDEFEEEGEGTTKK